MQSSMQNAKREEAEKKERRSAFWYRLLYGSCAGYTLMNLLFSLAYLLLFTVSSDKLPFATVLQHGISVKRHLLLFLAAFILSLTGAILSRKKPLKKASAFLRYIRECAAWFTLLEAMLILVYGFYLDTFYNPYDVTKAALLTGPSLLLTAGSLGIALCLPAVNRIYRLKIPSFFRLLLHLGAVLLLFCLFYLGLADGFSSPSAYLVFSAIVSILYAFAYLLWYLFHGAKQKDENDAQEYESMFQKTR